MLESTLVRTSVVPVLPRTVTQAASRARLGALDAVRGLVIVLMVLDHARDFFTAVRFSPTDLQHTTPALFLTRWITHLCAPTFILLAGVSAALVAERDQRAARWFLLKRGAWLMLLEITVVQFVWNFNVDYPMGPVMQVIWVIGLSMCALAGLSVLPRAWLAALGLAMMFGHNLFDGITPAELGSWGPLWNVLHVKGPTPFGLVLYPLIPWLGVMLLGYVAGPLFRYSSAERKHWLVRFGVAALIAFVGLRGLNVYGDPRPWQPQARAGFTLLSFLDVSKYPPSLAYLLVTLGIGCLLLAALEAREGRAAQALQVFGRVPLFAYVLHIAIVHALAGFTALALGHGAHVLTHLFIEPPPTWGFGLTGVYAAWLITLALLWPACRWFAELKRTRRDWWLSYL